MLDHMFMIKEEECNDDTSENFVSDAHHKILELNSKMTPRMTEG